MKNNPTGFARDKQPAIEQGPARKWVLVLATLIALGAVALIPFIAFPGRNQPVPSPNKASPITKAVESRRAAERDSPASIAFSAESRKSAPQLEAAPSLDARGLVRSLSEISVQPGDLTPEKADEWQHRLVMLIDRGTEALPALQEFLESNVDRKFNSGPGTNLLGEPTLRIAFLKVLSDIPAPANVELEEKLLRTATDPDEIALLARQLELQEPGKHREAIIKAASTALVRVSKGGFPLRYSTQLVELLQEYQPSGAK
jgi:hypothetical protein